VVLEVPLREQGRPHTWRAWTETGPDGRWRMRVPLPTDLSTPTIQTSAGQLRVGAGTARPLEVAEATVRAGGIIAAPGNTR
jgi:hypothetical protein